MEYSYTVRIPKSRVAVLIGRKGQVKRKLEKLAKSNLDIDSREGTVNISGDDNLAMFQLQDVVKAIGRGFNPDIAQLLLKQDYILKIVKVTDYVKDSKNHIQRARGRVIGTDGKARDTLEKMSETFISVFGKTVSIIGTLERAKIARKAVDSLLSGAPHGPVYHGLEESMRQLKKKEVLG